MKLTKREISEIDQQLEDGIRKELGLDGSDELQRVTRAAKSLVRAQDKLENEIVGAYATGLVGARKIADAADVSHMTVMRIVRKRSGVAARSDQRRLD